MVFLLPQVVHILQKPLQRLETLQGDVGILAADAEKRVGLVVLGEGGVAQIVVQLAEADTA